MRENTLWKTYSYFYDSLLLTYPYKKLVETVIEKADLKADEMVIDLGSGTGNIPFIAKRNDNNYYCLDSSKSMLKISKLKNPNCSHVEYNLDKCKLPFSENTADKIISNNSLYTVTNKIDSFLEDVNRVLKKEGLFVCSNSVKESNMPIIKETLRHLKLEDVLKIDFWKLLIVLFINLFVNKRYKTNFYSEDELFEKLKANNYKILDKTSGYAGINIIFVCQKY